MRNLLKWIGFGIVLGTAVGLAMAAVHGTPTAVAIGVGAGVGLAVNLPRPRRPQGN